MPVRFHIDDPSHAGMLRQVVRLVRQAGGRAWLVGGSVRDLVLGRQPRDLDIEVFGLAPGTLHAVLAEQFSVQFVGKTFGIFKLQGQSVDISIPAGTLEENPSVPHLLRQADPSMPVDDALARRDFTINAMAWDPDTLEFRDPFQGQEDLHNHVLRHVSSRFCEDPLRVLRGMQLSARFELTAAAETVTLCHTLSQEGLPSERLLAEWRTLLVEGHKPSLGLQFLQQCGWLTFYPELAALRGCPQDPTWHPEGDVWIHTLHCLDWFAGERSGNKEDDLIVGLAILCHDFGKPATTRIQDEHIISRGHESEGTGPTKSFLERLTNQQDIINDVIPLVQCHLRPRALFDTQASDSAIRRLARQTIRIDRLVRVARADHAGRPPKPFDGFPAGDWLLTRAKALAVDRQVPQPIIMGRHLLSLGVQPGPEMGHLLDECYEAQLEGVFATLEDGLNYAQRELPPPT